jgi:glycosyltransferase involved in cell wall biosynthesis
MRVVFVLPDLERPPTKGYQVRTLAFAEFLREKHDVILMTARGNQSKGLKGLSVAALSSVRSAAALLVRGWPIQAALFDGPGDAAKVCARIRQLETDVVVVVTERLPFSTMKLAADYPVVLDVIDSQGANMRQRARHFGWPKSLLFAREARAFDRLARVFGQCISHAVVCADRERSLYPKATVVPNGATRRTRARMPFWDVVFTGNLAYWPNVEAVRELCAEVAPRVRRRVPGARILVAGSNPSKQVRKVCSAAQIELRANVRSIPDILCSAHLAVAPLRSATGMQLKVVEALGCGTPVLAYSAVIDGLPEGVGGVILCATPSEMAERIVGHLTGEAVMQSGSLQELEWASLAVKFEDSIEGAAAKRAAMS